MIGESGAEAVVPLEDRSRGIPLWEAAGKALGMHFEGPTLGARNIIGAVPQPVDRTMYLVSALGDMTKSLNSALIDIASGVQPVAASVPQIVTTIANVPALTLPDVGSMLGASGFLSSFPPPETPSRPDADLPMPRGNSMGLLAANATRKAVVGAGEQGASYEPEQQRLAESLKLEITVEPQEVKLFLDGKEVGKTVVKYVANEKKREGRV
jgi:hypothetical protein